MANRKKKAPKLIYLLEVIRNTIHVKTGLPLEIRDYRLYESLPAAKGERTRAVKQTYGDWKVRGHIYSATVDWTPLPEYEESVYDDAFSRLDAEIEVDIQEKTI